MRRVIPRSFSGSAITPYFHSSVPTISSVNLVRFFHQQPRTDIPHWILQKTQIRSAMVCRQSLRRNNGAITTNVTEDFAFNLFGLGLLAQSTRNVRSQNQLIPILQRHGSNLLDTYIDISDTRINLHKNHLHKIAQACVMIGIPVPDVISAALGEHAPKPCLAQEFSVAKLGITAKYEALVCDFCFVDLLIEDMKLIIEIDGPHHKEPKQKAKDELRDTLLKKHGYTVLRIPVEEEIAEDVVAKVLEIVKHKKIESTLNTMCLDSLGIESVQAH